MNKRMNDLQLLGKKEYLKNVITEYDITSFFDIHKHLEVVTVNTNKNPNFIRIPEIFIRHAKQKNCIYIYIMVIGRDNNIYQLGGISINFLVEKGEFIGSTKLNNSEEYVNDNCWHIIKSLFSKFVYYDKNSYDMENETIQQQQTKPFDLCLKFLDSVHLSSLISKIVNPSRLLQKRYTLLKNVSHNAYSYKKISNQKLISNYQYIINEFLFEEENNNNQNKEWCIVIEITSYWLFQRYVSFNSLIDSPSRKWISEQEERIIKFRLETQYQTESDILQLLKYNGLISTLATQCIYNSPLLLETDYHSEIKLQCEELFKDYFPESNNPTVWFSISVIDCLELGLEGSKIIIDKGKCYLSYKHLQYDYLPKLLSSLILNGYYIDLNDNSNSNLSHDFDLFGKEILKQISKNLTIDLLNIDKSKLSDIENDITTSSFPLCKFMLRKTLLEKNHLKFAERYAYASFLLDIGYEKDQIESHLRKYFSKGGTSKTKFDTKYMHALQYNDKGKCENGKRIIPYGMGCKKIINNTIFNSEIKVGCPFNSKVMKYDDLKNLIIESGINSNNSSIEEILYTFSQLESPMAACAQYFKAKHEILPQNNLSEWRPLLPQLYVNESLNTKNNKRKGEHIDIDYQQ